MDRIVAEAGGRYQYPNVDICGAARQARAMLGMNPTSSEPWSKSYARHASAIPRSSAFNAPQTS